MRRIIAVISLVALLAGSAVLAQSTVPVLAQPLPAQTLAPGVPAVTLDLRNYFSIPGLTGQRFAQFDTVLGRFNVELRSDVAPRHVTNFFNYVQSGTYASTFIHRSAPLDASGSISIIQGGGYGYRVPFDVFPVAKLASVPLEYNLPNARGTLAAARSTDVNSATSEWYINTRDNSAILDQSNGGGYTVFGRVLGSGMTVVDAIAALPRFNAGSPFTDLPLRNFTSGGNVTESNLVVVNSVREASLFPTGGGTSVVDLAVQNSAPDVVTTVLSGSTLTLTAVAPGTANISVRAVDSNGNAAEGSFAVAVMATKPAFVTQPAAQTVAAGSTVVFNAPITGVANFRWERDGQTVPGASGPTLLISAASAADAGTYVAIASNSLGETRSDAATLTVSADPGEVGRLVNLSILTSAGAGAKVLTMGAVIGAGNGSAALPLVIRAVGPTLAQPPFNVGGVLADPVMDFYAAGAAAPIESNDNWGGSPAFAAAFQSVGAFALPAGSADSAIVRAAPGVASGGYTVQVTGKGSSTGTVIAEMYDAAGSARTAGTPRLINLSTRAQIDPNTDLAVGFVLGGQSARTVLIRGVGPSLAVFGVTGLMSDPGLELFDNNTGRRIAVNDDWAGSLEVATVAASVGAFSLASPTSKDAVILVTLPPGPYSARIRGAGGAGGAALVEVYEVR
jgi:cyclophilin family peptidyl-prolyl cis-trans isomerase